MAYITYRQSDNTQTKAQIDKKDYVKDSPLSMYEVDANFKSVNDDLHRFKNVYGVGASTEDGSSVEEIYNVNDANKIDKTGFYTTEASTANMPSTVLNGSAVLHIESTKQTASDKLTAFELTSDDDNLWHRVRKGTSGPDRQPSWDNWEKIVTDKDVKNHTASLQSNIDKKVSKNGDAMTGTLTIANSGSLNIINPVAIKDYSVGSALYTASLSFLDQRGLTNVSNYGSYRLGGVSNEYEANSTNLRNETFLRASNPADPDQEISTKLAVGWKRAMVKDDSGNEYEQLVEYTEAPHPLMDIDVNPKQIATVGWTTEQIQSTIDIKFNPDAFLRVTGGSIDGSLEISEKLAVEGSIETEDEIAGAFVVSDLGIDSYGPINVGYQSVDGQPQYTYNSTGPATALTSGVAFSISSDSDVVPPFMEEGQHGGLKNRVEADGTNTVSIVAKQWSTASTPNATQYSIGVTVDKEGNVTTHAPTPKDTSDSNEIVTTEWIRKNIASLIDLGEM